jgi:hypothetical protein
MPPTSYVIVSQTPNSNGTQTVIYTDQNNYLYEIIVDLNANLDQIILYP